MHQKQGLGPVVIVIILAVLLGGGYVAYRTLSGTNQTCWPYCPEMTDEDREDIKKQARDAYYAETYADNSHIITEYADQFIPEGGSSWKTYRNERYGFEIRYPAEYSVSERTYPPMMGSASRIDIMHNEYSLAIFVDNNGGSIGIRTSEEVALCCKRLSMNDGRDYVWRTKSPGLPEEPAGGIYYFNFYGFKPSDKFPDFDYSFASTLVDSHTHTPFAFAYVLPKGVTEANYDESVISVLDQILSTFRFTK